jgi:hypothetical protein
LEIPNKGFEFSKNRKMSGNKKEKQNSGKHFFPDRKKDTLAFVQKKFRHGGRKKNSIYFSTRTKKKIRALTKWW